MMRFKISFIGIMSLVCFFAHESFAQTVTRGPYLQLPTHESIFIKWRTDQPTDSKVNYGADPLNLDQSATVNQNDTTHIVKISGLQPFTKYYYSVGTTSQVLSGPDSLHRFVTSPAPGVVKPVRVWAIGDFGKGNQLQQDVRDAYFDFTGETHTDVWLWLGDNVYDSGEDFEYQAKVFPTAYYGNVFKFQPFWACPGNHDYESISPPFSTKDPKTHTGAYYEIIEAPTDAEAGGVASDYELYYSFDYSNVHFLSLNSEIGSVLNPAHDWTGVQQNTTNFDDHPFKTWLINDLENNTKPWTIAYFHQPPYSKGSHDSDNSWELYMKAMRDNVIPILEQYNVDIILNGHSHVYERSYFIKNHFIIDLASGIDSLGEAYVKDLNQPNGNQGSVYVVTGCSGAHDNDAPLNHTLMYAGYDENGGSFIMDIDEGRLDGRFLNSNGEIIDHFTILKIDSATSLDPVTAQNFKLKVAPNPFKKELTVSYNLQSSEYVSIELFDLQGKKLQQLLPKKRVEAGQHSPTFDTKDWNSTTIYLLKITIGKHEFTQQVMRVR